MPETIYYETLPVCRLTGNDARFLVYDDAWANRSRAFPVSLSMPLATGGADIAKAMPWFANLLPEAQLSYISQQLKVSPQDVLGILAHIGRDTAGALSIGAPRGPGTNLVEISGEKALEKIIDELPIKPFLLGEAGVSMSLAGVQEKIALVQTEGRFYIPVDGTPSTHILKPDTRRLAGSVQNEAFCMTLSRLSGLSTATVTTGVAGRRSYLLMERYDRVTTQDGWSRIHQEDFCQLLGYFPISKYEGGGALRLPGPGLRAMFEGLNTYVSPGARLDLLDGVIMNVLLCNTDSHAKNYSVLVGAGGSARFAPLYDLMCAAPYPRVDKVLPQQINGRWDGAVLHGFDWIALAQQADLSPARTLERVKELAELVEAHAAEAARIVAAMPAGGHAVLEKVAHEVVKRSRRLRRQASVTRGEA